MAQASGRCIGAALLASRSFAMAAFDLSLKCPGCGREGVSRASVGERAYYLRHAGFQVDEYPAGFSEAKRSGFQQETEARCSCGSVFKL